MNWAVFAWRLQTLVSMLLLLPPSLALANRSTCKFVNHKNEPDISILAFLVGHRFSVNDAEGSYLYSLGICTYASDDKVGGDDAGVIQVDLKDKTSHIIGKLSQADIRAGTDWVMLEYRKGDNYTHHCKGENRKAVIMITCDPSVYSLSDVHLQLLEEQNDKNSECYYLFEMGHHSICKDASLVTFSLSLGSIIVIVFISVCALYLILGFLYNRFLLGAKGMEQIPNYSFWKDFGNLQADGCNFICRTERGQESRSYKGIGDDQLQEDDERDDHLLPM